METLTPTQSQVFDYVKSHVHLYGYAPTMREISEEFGWSSVNSAQQHLKALQKKGYLENTPRGYMPA